MTSFWVQFENRVMIAIASSFLGYRVLEGENQEVAIAAVENGQTVTQHCQKDDFLFR